VLIIGAETVRRLLPMPACIEAMDQAMRAYSSGQVDTPDRIIAPLADGESYFILMPGELRTAPVYGGKIVSLHPANPGRGRAAVQGFVVLFDSATGTPAALVDGAEITRIRTAAASALATRVLARPDAATHGILGAGVQAASHLEAISSVRHIQHVRVWARDAGKARAFAQRYAASAVPEVEAVEDPAAAAACDVVSVTTNAPQPVLRGAWLRPGAHLNLIGAHEAEHREADSDAVAGAAVYVDSRRGALREAGDLLIPITEGRFDETHIRGELGDVLDGRVPGRESAEQVTLYKSLGLVAQDLFAAEFVFGRAAARGAGQRVELD